MVRVRFAPSPTGFLHVGGLRTALYNFLYARHHGGVNVLRIEDTDRTRLVPGAVENFIEVCRWAGIEFDESPEKGGNYGPYVQSERFDLYRAEAMKLLENETAYYAFDTSEELDRMRERQQKAGIVPKYDRSTMRNQYTLGAEETQRLLAAGEPWVLRLKVPLTREVKFSDLIRGEMIIAGREIDDQVLLKSDGFPTYHLANVVDDHYMNITHVIRGEEWLPSTPKHVLLYEAFGWEIPKFAHLPLLLNPDKTKLSKRQGDVAVEDYRAKGYMPEALINFVAMLGWNPTADREIFSMQELIDTFTLEKVNKAGAVFDVKKLEWVNSQYLRAASPQVLAPELVRYINDQKDEKGFETIGEEYAARVITLLRERVHRVIEIPDFGDYMFRAPVQVDEEYKKKHWNHDAKNRMNALVTLFSALSSDEFTAANLEAIAKKYADENSIKIGQLLNPLRLSVTGKSLGASMFETMAILGKEKALSRIERFAQEN